MSSRWVALKIFQLCFRLFNFLRSATKADRQVERLRVRPHRSPASFGPFANDLLLGNFSFVASEINAFDPLTGAFLGTIPSISPLIPSVKKRVLGLPLLPSVPKPRDQRPPGVLPLPTLIAPCGFKVGRRKKSRRSLRPLCVKQGGVKVQRSL
jgi:hypothetical protein